jgi:hypothetical protein
MKRGAVKVARPCCHPSSTARAAGPTPLDPKAGCQKFIVMAAEDEAPADLGGIELAAQFHAECVEPLLREHHPELRYASALIGPGSEILGFDDKTSRDHDWGPRLMLFLEPADRDEHGDSIREVLRRSLPTKFRGYSTHWEEYADDPGVAMPATGVAGDVNHRVVIHTVDEYLASYLGPHPLLGSGDGSGSAGEGAGAQQQERSWQSWLSIPQQKLRTIAAGAVFRDDVGTLTQARAAAAAYFPRDIWLYMLHAGYARLGQLSHFMGRCGMVGDELGSRLIAAQLVHDVMHLCFLLERTYAPYPKWFGTGFSKLRCAAAMQPHLNAAMDGGGGGGAGAGGWQARDDALAETYRLLGEALNAAAADTPGAIPTQADDSHVQQFWDRPFHVPNVAGSDDEGWVTTQLAAAIEDEELKALCDQRPIGAAEQHIDSTDVLENPMLLASLGDVAYRL